MLSYSRSLRGNPKLQDDIESEICPVPPPKYRVVFVSPLVDARSNIAQAFCRTPADGHSTDYRKFPRIKECIVDGESVTIELIDTLGPGPQDDYFEEDVMDGYIHRGDGFIFIYSADHRKSLELAKENYRRVLKIKKHERDNATNPIPAMLVAVRVEEDRAMWMEVPWEDGNNLAEEMGVAFMQVSLKNGRNVDEVFIHIARLIKKHQDRKKRISNIHWAYYDQKVLDDRYEREQEMDEHNTTAGESKVPEQVDYGPEFEKEWCTGCCTGCFIA